MNTPMHVDMLSFVRLVGLEVNQLTHQIESISRSRTYVDHVPVLRVRAHRWSPATVLPTTRWSFPGEQLQPERWRPDGGRCMCPSSGSFHTTSAPSLFFCFIRNLSAALPPSAHLTDCSTDGSYDGYIHPQARREPVLKDCMFLDPSLKLRR